jgi:uncharacterized membrane protein SpoIIM required for sporulation
VRSANLLASFIIIPTALLIQGESVVMFWGNYSTLWWVAFGLFVLAVLLVRVGLAHFQREELLGRELDVLNVRWIWRTFRSSFSGGAKTIPGWYRLILRQALPAMKLPILIVSVIMIAGVVIGYGYVDQLNLSITSADREDVLSRMNAMVDFLPSMGLAPVGLIVWQNVRVLLISMVAGVFTLGVLGVLPLLATVGVVGFLAGLLMNQGYSLLAFAGLILPHGIFEIPAAVLSTAAVLYAGAVLATPTPGKTIGEAWLSALANWAKILIGLVIPLLVLAALIEVWITPKVAMLLF